ncbi:MAG: hypothetical protein AABW75_04740 [Nanoarchaeota archaeon]
MEAKNTNKSKENKFKKLILSWWFWLLIFFVSFVFLDVSNEGSTLETLILYFISFSLLVAIILIGVSIIKRIQNSSIGDYWKISWTIIGIVLIIAFTFFYFKDNLLYSFDGRIGDLNNAEEIKMQINLLEENNYEVIYFDHVLENSSLEGGSITMKSFGNRENQVWKGLFALNRVYPNALTYHITLIEPTKECSYLIDGSEYRNVTNSYNYVKSKIREGTKYCS